MFHGVLSRRKKVLTGLGSNRVRQKNLWNQINKKKIFFSWNCISGSFKLFPYTKIDFWPFLKSRKMEFRPKKPSWSLVNQFHDFFWPNTIFCDFKNGQKSIFELGKSLKLPERQFHEKNFFLFIWFHEFFWLEFFKFSCPMWVHYLEPALFKTRSITNLR